MREFPLATGEADYLLFVDGKALGAVEAKPEGTTLKGVETQSGKYSVGLPDSLPAWHRPLPFLFESTGKITQFTNLREPDYRSRRVFWFHKPETLLELVQRQPLRHGLRAIDHGGGRRYPHARRLSGQSQQALLGRLRDAPLWPAGDPMARLPGAALLGAARLVSRQSRRRQRRFVRSRLIRQIGDFVVRHSRAILFFFVLWVLETKNMQGSRTL